jgi:nitrogen fixation NifU-like protein
MTEQDLEELYQDVILDHYKNPRCKGSCDNASASVEAYNPLCGDTIKLDVVVEGAFLSEIRYTGKGCSISQATASIMAELCSQRPVQEVEQLYKTFSTMILEEISPESMHTLGDAAVLRGVKKFPARYRCALLCWQALHDALEKTRGA